VISFIAVISKQRYEQDPAIYAGPLSIIKSDLLRPLGLSFVLPGDLLFDTSHPVLVWVDFLLHAISMCDDDIRELANQFESFLETPLDRLSHHKGFPDSLYPDPDYA
jgi:hypothetical protein